MSTRIAVTGGRGKVGMAVVAMALAQGQEVVEIDRTEPARSGPVPAGLTQVVADVRAYPEFARAAAGCTALVHLAAHPNLRERPGHEVHNDNVTGSYHALSLAAAMEMTHVCLASSINALGGYYSRSPRYDYFPLDERHPTYNEDAYGLSKWIAEAQADSIARRHESLTITSLRLHGVVSDVAAHLSQVRRRPEAAARQLWGYTLLSSAATACLLALTATFTGHEVCYVVAPGTGLDIPSAELRRRFYPGVRLRRELTGAQGFFDTTKATRLLGWRHEPA